MITSHIKKIVIGLSLLSLLPTLSRAQDKDSVQVFYHEPISVFAKKERISQSEFPADKGSLGEIFERNGFTIIRKGGFLAQDIYADGMKKSDIPIVVDGERYQCACPNRMDAPIMRITPLDVESVELDKSASNLQSGLGGVVSVHRSDPQSEMKIKSSLTQVAGNSQGTDVALLAEKFNNRISLRYTTGSPYENADGKSFKDLYKYKETATYKFAEAALLGNTRDWKYTASFMFSEDISFPYLQMDERNSKVYNASLAWKEYKAYINYTDHLMNNGLRTGYSTMQMETGATNLTVGIRSDFFDVYYRRWNADNYLKNSMMKVENNMIPEVNLYAASVQQKTNFMGVDIAGKVGLSYYNIGNEDALTFIKAVHKDAENGLLFPTFALNLSRSERLSDSFALGGMLDAVSEAPEAENLFINVKKMMNTVWTSGNPTLDQPLRTTLRAVISSELAKFEAFGSYVFNYVYLENAQVGMQKYLTYTNINALIAGISFDFNYDFIEVNASYTYGNNETDDRPLIEIMPLRLTTRLTSPELVGIKFYLRHTYENAQGRVDKTLNETSSGAWNTIDLGLSGKYNNLAYSVDVENVGNLNYYRHLSYLRDPFSSGNRVYEPGTNVRLNLRYYLN